MNAALRSLAEQTLIRLGVNRIAHRAHRSDTVILAYHNIVPSGKTPWGDSSLHLQQAKFAAQLDALVRSHDVVSLDALFDKRSESLTRPRAIITFDDAYAGAITAGVSELVKRGLPATIFVAPALLGKLQWWDILASGTCGVLPVPARRYALDTLAGKGELILQWAGVSIEEDDLEVLRPRIGTEAQVMAAASLPGISLGSHTWSHPNLTALTPEELNSELSRALKWIIAHSNRTLVWLAYPYGLYNDDVARAAANLGYVGALRIDGGLVSSLHPLVPTALPRINIPAGISQEGFRLRLVGL
jgi:peptidoglycan/xylan/chitin deacetylase (PgdA/CDA1 family)